jgi:beta-glucosidase
MMRFTKLISLVILFVCAQFSIAQQTDDPKMNQFISELMGKMTLEEKIGQLNLTSGGGGIARGRSGIDSLLINGLVGATSGFSISSIRQTQETAVKKSRLHIPLLFGLDVIHGYKTIFPIPLAMSTSWDPALIEKTARIAAIEASANGICWTYSPMLDIARDPRWGRIAEGSGEDPFLGSVIARAMIRGYQGDDLSKDISIMACVKHFALYGAAEAGRDYNTVDMSHLTMFEDYFPPYKAAFDAGAGSAMSSFNVIDYIPASGNRWLLTEILRKRWGFKGFVVADFDAVGQMSEHGMGDLQAVSALALKAGLDMDMASNGFLGTLEKSITEGKVTQSDIDQACRRILEAKYKLGLFSDPYKYCKEERSKQDVLTTENLQLAREISDRSIVLLKNQTQILPLKKSGTIAVIGPLANSAKDMLGSWVMFGDQSKVSTVIDGIKNVGGSKLHVLYAKGSNFTDDPMLMNLVNPFEFLNPKKKEEKIPTEVLIKAAVDTAKKADVIIAVLGEPAEWSGEAASRSDISLPESQRNLLKALLLTGKPVVLVLANGRPLTLCWEDENVNAIIEAWHGGMQASNAIADVLFGDYNPSGKLTTTFPRSVGQIPIYYNYRNTGRPEDPKNKFTTKYLDISNSPLYPFGYGLSYSTFIYGEIRLNKSQLKGNEKLTVTISITNTGKYAGEETVQLYIRDLVASISRPVKELKNFQKISLLPGEQKDVTMQITTEDLKFYNSELNYDWEPGEFIIYVGTNSRDVKSAKITWLK